MLATVPVSLRERVLTEISMLFTERPGVTHTAWKTSEPLWEKPFQDQDRVDSLPEVSLGFLRMNYRKKITYVSNTLCLKLFYIDN